MSEPIYTMGIDVGSAASKCVIMSDAKTIVGCTLMPSGAGTSGPGLARESALKEAELKENDLSFIMATGYGRNNEVADSEMSELTCHAKGAVFLLEGVRTVIDIGGQDLKVLNIDENGILSNFVMNEKCAAGTGRFLEVMARVLDVKLEDMGSLSEKSTERVDISSTCTVFAESEVISQLAQNKEIPDILAGIHRSVASRVAGIARRIGIDAPLMLTGGVSQNKGVRLALEEELEEKVYVDAFSPFAGAIGAAILGYKKLYKG